MASDLGNGYFYCHLFSGSNDVIETSMCQAVLGEDAIAGLHQPFGALTCGSEYPFGEVGGETRATRKTGFVYEDCPDAGVTKQWEFENFQCNRACGTLPYVQSRSVVCRGSDGNIYPDGDCSGAKPATSQNCLAIDCDCNPRSGDRWTYTEFDLDGPETWIVWDASSYNFPTSHHTEHCGIQCQISPLCSGWEYNHSGNENYACKLIFYADSNIVNGMGGVPVDFNRASHQSIVQSSFQSPGWKSCMRSEADMCAARQCELSIVASQGTTVPGTRDTGLEGDWWMGGGWKDYYFDIPTRCSSDFSLFVTYARGVPGNGLPGSQTYAMQHRRADLSWTSWSPEIAQNMEMTGGWYNERQIEVEIGMLNVQPGTINNLRVRDNDGQNSKLFTLRTRPC